MEKLVDYDFEFLENEKNKPNKSRNSSVCSFKSKSRPKSKPKSKLGGTSNSSRLNCFGKRRSSASTAQIKHIKDPSKSSRVF